jgi:EAL domain-containing protein (putative c-di-GMP-specific phosphodiesterase class I)
MAWTEIDGARFRDFAFAAADLLVSMDAQGRILEADGDPHLLHYPSLDRLHGKNAIDLISEAEGASLRRALWALAPGRRACWEDSSGLEGGRRITIQRDPKSPDCFNLALARTPSPLRIRGDGADDLMTERFRDIVMNGRLRAALQPIVDTHSGEVSHFEVLARFEGEESPAAMIAAAERSGQICHLDYIMVEAAARRLSLNPSPTYRLAVNVSGETIQRIDVIREIGAMISGHDFRPERLTIEVTESSRILDIEAAAQSVNFLRNYGVRVSLDDFGAGASSFVYLRSLAVDGLKFDGSFLSAPGDHSRNFALMKAVAGMCAELGISSVGERVETEADRRVLRAAGVRLAQGYLFGRPVIDVNFFERRPLAASSAA